MDDPSVQHTFFHEVDLTDRQMEVLRLKANRRTNAEIADKLVITLTTVKWHVRQIYNKLGANNRTEAVASARQLGLLEKRPEHQKGTLHNFPSPLTPFIGREQEIRQIITTLTDPDTRLVTLFGPGGIGKTRLALQAVGSLDTAFPDGVCWVPFSALDQAELVFTTIDEYIAENIYTAFGLSRQGTEEYTQLLETFLKNRQVLIVLDSFEILISGTSFISDILAKTTACKFLVTSRERLNLPGEVLYPVLGLRHSQDSEDSQPADAVNLFLQEASRVSQSDLDQPEHLAVVQRICSRLEGMPLAITLAAEWSRLLPVEAIEQELVHGLEFLDAGSASIRAVFDRSWNLLADQQRGAFAQLAVFQRGFTREAAQEVAGADLETLSALFDKSLIQQMGEGRYTFHDLLRQYAVEQLQAREEWDAARNAHCAFFAKLAEDQKESIFRGDHRMVLADLDNIRSAWRWAAQHRLLKDLLKMWMPFGWFLNIRASYQELAAARKMVIDNLESPHPEGLQGFLYGKALVGYGMEQSRISGVENAIPLVLQGVEIIRRLGAGENLAWALILSVTHDFFRNNPQTREQYCLESLEIFEELNDPYGIAFSLAVLGSQYRIAGNYSKSRQCIERSLAISRSIKDSEGIAHGLRHLGRLNLHMGHFEKACQNFQEEAGLWEQLSLPRVRSEALRSLGNATLAIGKLNEAEQIFLESLAIFEDLGDQGNALINLFDLITLALQQEKPQKAFNLLHDARLLIEDRQDSEERARWWLLSGRIDLQQGNAEAARSAFCQPLKNIAQVSSRILTETLADFAFYYYQLSDYETSAILLGFAQHQTGLSAVLVQSHIDPLHTSLAASLDETELNSLLEEGAAYDQQELVDRLLAECG